MPNWRPFFTLVASTVFLSSSIATQLFAQDSNPIEDCTIEVTKTESNEFSIRLMVPESVKVVELIPSDPSQQAFKFRLNQPKSNFAIADSNPSMRNNAGQTNSGDAPLAESNSYPLRTGFTRNPFFESPSKALANQLPSFNTTSEPFVAEAPYPYVNEAETEWVASQQPIESPAQNNEPISNAAKSDGQQWFDINMDSNIDMANTIPHVSDNSSTTQVSYDHQPVQADNVPQSFAHSNLTTELSGPDKLAQGQSGDYVVYVHNATAETASEVTVKLQLPKGFDVLVLDRHAWIDSNQGTLIWELPTVEPGGEHFIRYRVQAIGNGEQTQLVSVSIDEKVVDDAVFETKIGENTQ